MPFKEIRNRIDVIDAEIVRLLDSRARAGREIAELKRAAGQPLRNPDREAEVLARLGALSGGDMPPSALKNIFRAIIAETLALEEAARPCPGHAASGKVDARAEIAENSEIAPGFFRMRLRVPELAGAFRPGQFFQLRLDPAGDEPFLRRPFAPSAYLPDGFAFVYAVVGDGTRRMTTLAPGGRVSILAPLGVPFNPLPAGSSALLIGGGCGGPSLAPLAGELAGAGVRTTVVLGARTASGLLEREALEREADLLIVATDDGSLGCRGTSIDAYRLEAAKAASAIDCVYACGPIPMLRGAAALAEELGADCEVSLEERMACGFGACMGCAVPVRSGDAAEGFVYRRVCHEGPVFNARDLAWDAMR